MKNRSHIFFLAILCTTIAISACNSIAKGGQSMNYSFSFDMTEDQQTAIVLDYRLSADGNNLIAPTSGDLASGRPFRGWSQFGKMEKPTALYVKWKDPSSGVHHEETANLKDHLPVDITGMHIYFLIRENHLFVYLSSTEKRQNNIPAIGPEIAQYHVTTQIYPN